MKHVVVQLDLGPESDSLFLWIEVDSSVGEVNGKDGTGLGVAWDGEDLPALFQKEDPDGDVEVGITGLLVVVEYTDPVCGATEDTPPLLPALWEREERGMVSIT